MVQFLFDFVSLFLEERCHVVLTPKGEIYIYIYIYIYRVFYSKGRSKSMLDGQGNPYLLQ